MKDKLRVKSHWRWKKYTPTKECDNNMCVIREILPNGNIVFDTCHSRSPIEGWPEKDFLSEFEYASEP